MLRVITMSLCLSLVPVALVAVERDALADHAKVAIAEARKVALARVPGTIVHEKTKTKKHGKVVYYIKIRPRDAAAGSDVVKKVEVDGATGQIIKIKDSKLKSKDD